MKHLVITLSMYGPEVDVDWNARRVDLVEANSAPSIAAQTTRDFEWMVCLHPDDPLLDRRIKAFSEGADCRFVYYDPEGEKRNDPVEGRVNARASGALVENWRQVSYRVDRLILPVIREHDQPLLLTRFDDDDAFAVDAFARIQSVLQPEAKPVLWMQPQGFVIWATHPIEIQPFRHPANGFSSIQAPPGSRIHPFSYGHNRVVDHLPMRIVDEEPAWVMFRHEDNMSLLSRKHARVQGRTAGVGGASGTEMTFGRSVPLARGLTPEFRGMFPLDWDRQW